MNKQSLYLNAFATPLVVRELNDNSLQFASLDLEVIERIRVESNARGFGAFSGAPAWGKDVGRIRRAHLHVSWLFNLPQVANYLAQVAQCKYTIEFRPASSRQGYGVATGDSSNG